MAMNLPAIIQEHFQHPRHVGFLAPAANICRIEVNSLNTSRHVIMYAALANGTIRQVRYQVRGCPYTIATFSYVADWCLDKPLPSITELNRKTLIEILDLPATKVHCAAMAEDILQQLQRQGETIW